MSKQQKDKPSSSGTGAGSMSRSDTTSPGDGGQGLRKQDKDDTGGPRGDALSGAVGAAAAGRAPGNGSIPPPSDKGGASKT